MKLAWRKRPEPVVVTALPGVNTRTPVRRLPAGEVAPVVEEGPPRFKRFGPDGRPLSFTMSTIIDDEALIADNERREFERRFGEPTDREWLVY